MEESEEKVCIGYTHGDKLGDYNNNRKIKSEEAFTIIILKGKKKFGQMTFCQDCFINLCNLGGDLLLSNLAKDYFPKAFLDEIIRTNSIEFNADTLYDVYDNAIKEEGEE